MQTSNNNIESPFIDTGQLLSTYASPSAVKLPSLLTRLPASSMNHAYAATPLRPSRYSTIDARNVPSADVVPVAPNYIWRSALCKRVQQKILAYLCDPDRLAIFRSETGNVALIVCLVGRRVVYVHRDGVNCAAATLRQEVTEPGLAHGGSAVGNGGGHKFGLACKGLHVLHPCGGCFLGGEVRLCGQIGLVEPGCQGRGKFRSQKTTDWTTNPSRYSAPLRMAVLALADHWLV